MMSNEQANEPAPRPSPRLRGIIKESIADTWEAMDHVEEKADPGRLQFIGALILGVCIVFLASLLSLPRLDTALQVAVGAFAVGIAILVLDYTFASLKFGPGLRKLYEWYGTGLQIAAWAIGDSVGGAAVFVGVLAILWHLSEGAFWAGIIAYAAGFLAFGVVALVYSIRQAVRAYDEHQAKESQEKSEQTGQEAP
jgi:hypothetical protein